MIFVDTGYFIALADPNDQHHARARAWSKSVIDHLLVTEYVLVETVNAMSRVGWREHAREAVRWAMTEDQFVYEEASRAWFNAGFALHRDRPDKDWSLTDCISFEVMRSQRITRALAHDHHFEQAGFQALLRHDPPAQGG